MYTQGLHKFGETVWSALLGKKGCWEKQILADAAGGSEAGRFEKRGEM
jgi:hypothetical protein